MAFVPVPATIRVNFFQTLNGQPTMNRIHVRGAESLPSQGSCAVVAASLAGWWDTNVQALVGTGLSLREVQAVSIAEQNGPQASFTAGFPLVGTLDNPMLPGNCAFCVSWRTGLTGRSARGRWYWQGLVEPQVVDNNVDEGVAAAIVAAMDNLITTITGISAFPVIVSYNSGGGPRVGGPVTFLITDALAVDTVVDSQRGRLH